MKFQIAHCGGIEAMLEWEIFIIMLSRVDRLPRNSEELKTQNEDLKEIRRLYPNFERKLNHFDQRRCARIRALPIP